MKISREAVAKRVLFNGNLARINIMHKELTNRNMHNDK